MVESKKRVVITSAVRTAAGSFGGTLKDIKAAELGGIVIKEALRRSNVDSDKVDEVIMGQVLTAGFGANPAKVGGIIYTIKRHAVLFRVFN